MAKSYKQLEEAVLTSLHQEPKQPGMLLQELSPEVDAQQLANALSDLLDRGLITLQRFNGRTTKLAITNKTVSMFPLPEKQLHGSPALSLKQVKKPR